MCDDCCEETRLESRREGIQDACDNLLQQVEDEGRHRYRISDQGAAAWAECVEFLRGACERRKEVC